MKFSYQLCLAFIQGIIVTVSVADRHISQIDIFTGYFGFSQLFKPFLRND